MVEKGKISGCFKNITCIVLLQCQNKVSSQRKVLASYSRFLANARTFFENLFYFHIAGEKQKCCFEVFA